MSDIKQKTILLVEDEVIIAMMEVQQLKDEGYRVIHTTSGEKAIDIVRVGKEPIDLILMDIDLGKGMDGTETSKEILKNHDIPILFLSSHIEKEVVKKTENISSYGYVVKNSTFTVLDASIKMAFKLHKAHLELIEKEKIMFDQKEKFRAFFEQSPLGIGLWSKDLIITDCNEKFAQMLNTTLDRIIGLDLNHLKEKQLIPMLKKALNGEVVTYEGEYHSTTSDAVVQLSIAVSPLRDSNGNVIGGMNMAQDISERKRAEEELKSTNEELEVLNEQLVQSEQDLMKSESFLNSIINQSPNPMWISDESGMLIRINKACLDMLNLTAEDVIGKYNVLHDNIVEEQGYLPLVRNVYEKGEIARFELRYDSSQLKQLQLSKYAFVILDVNIFPIRDGNGKITNAVIQHIDITKRKQVEDELRESEEISRMIIELAIDYVFAVDIKPDGKPVLSYISENFYHITGREPEDIIDPAGWLSLFHSDDIACFLQFQESVVKDGHTGELECRTFTKSGVLRWINIYVHPFIDKESNRVTKILGAVKDITERKNAEEKVISLLKEKELLLKETHHRVKNNMSVVKSLLILQANTQGDPVIKNIINDAASRVQSMLVLYEKLYCTDNYNEISIKEFLLPLIDDIIRLFHITTSVKTDISIDDFVLNSKILSNIGIIINEMITNSLKYAFKDISSGLITVSASKKENNIILIYGDNGIGLPESITVENSTGFGLQLIGMLVQQIVGSIKIERDNGTKYIIEFKV